MPDLSHVSTKIVPPQWAKSAQGLELDAQSSDMSSNELGRLAEDVGAVISKWKSNLNDALNTWLSDVDAMGDVIDVLGDAADVLSALIPGAVEASQSGETTVDMNPTQYSEMINAMEALGIPSDEIAQSKGTAEYGAYEVMNLDDLIYDIKLIVQYMKVGAQQVSKDQQAETKDLMAVMFCYNSVKMNEESLTGLLQTITSISQTLMENAKQ